MSTVRKCAIFLATLCIFIILTNDVDGRIRMKNRAGANARHNRIRRQAVGAGEDGFADPDVTVLSFIDATVEYGLNETVTKRQVPTLPPGTVIAYVLFATCDTITFWIADLTFDFAGGWMKIKVYTDPLAIPSTWTRVYENPSFSFLDIFPTFTVTLGPYEPCTTVYIIARLKNAAGQKRMGTFTISTDCPCDPGSGEGDPHYRTFGNKQIDFSGRCSYVLTEICRPEDAPIDFRVTTTHGPTVNPANNANGRRIQSAEVIAEGHSIILHDSGDVELDGTIINGAGMTKDLAAGVQVLNEYVYLVFSMETQWWVEWKMSPRFSRHRLCIGIHPDSDILGNLCGLLGNKVLPGEEKEFQGFQKKDGTYTYNINELGNSWEVANSCPLQ